MGASLWGSWAEGWMPGIALLGCPLRWSSLPPKPPSHRALQVLNTSPPIPSPPSQLVLRPSAWGGGGRGNTAWAGVAGGWAGGEEGRERTMTGHLLGGRCCKCTISTAGGFSAGSRLVCLDLSTVTSDQVLTFSRHPFLHLQNENCGNCSGGAVVGFTAPGTSGSLQVWDPSPLSGVCLVFVLSFGGQKFSFLMKSKLLFIFFHGPCF